MAWSGHERSISALRETTALSLYEDGEQARRASSFTGVLLREKGLSSEGRTD
jgi:hypothetical protein